MNARGEIGRLSVVCVCKRALASVLTIYNDTIQFACEKPNEVGRRRYCCHRCCYYCVRSQSVSILHTTRLTTMLEAEAAGVVCSKYNTSK